MIKTNIWVFFCFYLIYALTSAILFLITSGGWIAIFYYLGIANLFYLSSSIVLFLRAAFRSRRRRAKVKVQGEFFFRIITLQVFVVLFNYSICGDNICSQGFLPTLLEDTNIPILFAPPFVVIVLALILYMSLLWLFLLDVG